MPQEFMVLKCCECEMFQVHQVKKSRKWQCKICFQKQSQIKIFEKGDGKFCRQAVQTLNLKKIDTDQIQHQVEVTKANCENLESDVQISYPEMTKCNWGEFETADHESSSSDENENNFTTELDEWKGSKTNKRKRTIVNKKPRKIPLLETNLTTANKNVSSCPNSKLPKSSKQNCSKVIAVSTSSTSKFTVNKEWPTTPTSYQSLNKWSKYSVPENDISSSSSDN